MAKLVADIHTTKLKAALDPIQKRFSCGEDELCVCRNTLRYRYSTIDNNEISVEICVYDINDTLLPGIPQLISVTPPSKLSKIVIRILSNKTKKYQLHFTLQVSGTLLWQGRDSTHWDSDGCEAIKNHVETFMENKDVEQVAASLL